jgi:RsiW-degrading membrane proteinase PrsW (M82 family)
MLGCGCLFALGAAAFPRLALLSTWLFTPLVTHAFHATFLRPLLGIIFLQFTTLMYVLVYIPGIGLTGWG